MKRFLAILMAVVMVLAMTVPAMAATADSATIDTSRVGSINLYKYDLTNAEKDGVWDSSYVSTGVRDIDGVENILNQARVGASGTSNTLGNSQTSVGYAVKGVEFTYYKVADIRTYTESEAGTEHVEVLYGIVPNQNNLKFLTAIGVAYSDRYIPADATVGGQDVYYFRSDTLNDGLASALAANATNVKDALESYIVDVGGTVMPETDNYGHTSADNLPLGLYLFVETKLPEMITCTANPFFISLPMTSVNGGPGTGNPGTAATDGGERWIYDVTIYPKNLSGIPSLEKTLRESKADTGVNTGSATDISDGFAHNATASEGDKIDNQIISTMPSITSAATHLTEYTFVDTMDPGLSFVRNDVKIEIFKDAACSPAQKVASWTQADAVPKFSVAYSTAAGNKPVMTISMTQAGLDEINQATTVYTGASMVNRGYSDCTMRITYQATLNSDSTMKLGDTGNQNAVVMTWKRSGSSYYDALVDDAHVYSYGIDLLKTFSDGRGDYSKVEFLIHNDTDDYFVTGHLDNGIWYVDGHVAAEADATHFIPVSTGTPGSLIIKGMEDDTYTITEVRTDNAYTLLKDNIKVVISRTHTASVCDIYTTDAKGLLQNDPRFASVLSALSTTGGLANPLLNIPQRQLEHNRLTASAKIDNNDVTMTAEGTSQNALAPLMVVNTRGFDLPQTGGSGNWMFPAFGLGGFAVCIILFVFVLTKKDKKKDT